MCLHPVKCPRLLFSSMDSQPHLSSRSSSLVQNSQLENSKSDSTIVKHSAFGVGPLQGEKDWQKYEIARRLKKCVDKIRNQYREDWKSKEMKVRQRAVALYFIDKVGSASCQHCIKFSLTDVGRESLLCPRP